MELTGVAALVTGAASGLGAATAHRLEEAGAAVVGVDLRPPTRDTAGSFVAADVREPEQVAAAVEAAGRLGPLRVVVNCAGVAAPGRTLSRSRPLDLEAFRQVVEVNLVGTFNVLRLAAQAMAATELVAGERGVIVNTSSAAAFDGQIGQASYAASKAGISGMTLPVARDLARCAIRVVSVAPGMFDTPILAKLSEEARRSLEVQVPHPSRLGQPSEFAELVHHVVANPMLNGETIRLDGAMRMGPA